MSEVDSNIGLSLKLKKLKLAQKLALTRSKKKKILDEANELLESSEDSIKSLALRKFVVNKTKRLKKLGETKESIEEFITSIAVTNSNLLDKTYDFLTGFGIDKKFINLDADEILEKIGVASKVSTDLEVNAENFKETDKTQNKVSSDKQDINKDKSDTLDTKTVQLLNSTIVEEFTKKLSSEDVVLDSKTVQLLNSTIVEEFTKKLSSEDVVLDTKTVQTDKPKSSVSESVPLKINGNSDTDTISDIERNNEEIYDYLVREGELDIAEYILDLMTKPESDVKNTSDIIENTESIKKLSIINLDIAETLEEIKKNSFDAQDTSIQSALKQESEKQKEPLVEKPEDKTNWLDDILNSFFGKGIAMLFKGAKTVLGLVGAILKVGAGLIKNLFNGFFMNAFKLAIAPFAKGIEIVKDFVMKIISKIGSFVPGLSKLIPEYFKKPAVPVKTAPTAIPKDAGKPIAKPTSAKIPITPPGKVAKPFTKVSETIGKAAGKTASKAATKVASAGKLVSKLLVFAKPIPILGTALMAGTAIYSGISAYQNASEIIGKPDEELTELERLSAAAGGVVNDFTFGLIPEKTVSDALLTGDFDIYDSVLSKYEKDGIIDHNYLGKSEVVDWEELSKLEPSKIQTLIDTDDFSAYDVARMRGIIDKPRLAETIETPEEMIANKTAQEEQLRELVKMLTVISSSKKEYEKAGDAEKSEMLDNSIISIENQIDVLSKQIKEYNVQIADKEIVNKDKANKVVNNSYVNNVKNTVEVNTKSILLGAQAQNAQSLQPSVVLGQQSGINKGIDVMDTFKY